MKKIIKTIKIGSDTKHSRSMLKNLAISLIFYGAIETTKPRSRALRSFIERLITIAKKNTVASSRLIYDRLRNEKATKLLIQDIAVRLKDRNSGYVRIIKVGESRGDNAPIYRVSFVDYAPKKKKSSKTKKTVKKEDKPQEEQNKGLIGRVRNIGRGKKEEVQDKSKMIEGQSSSRAHSRSGI